MQITVFVPKKEFTNKQQVQLSRLGSVFYVKNRAKHSWQDLKRLTAGSEIIAADPDILGGFEKAKLRLTKLMKALPRLKGVALASTTTRWIDLEYCQKRGVVVTNVPGYSTESVAEHTLALLLCLAKKIIISDRRTQKGEYKLDMGFELKGKILGIIGLGNIGTRVAELAHAVGMKVIAWNRSPKRQNGVRISSLNQVLALSDAISINITQSKETDKFISKKEIVKMKKGVIIVNLATRGLVNEFDMAESLKNGKVAFYVYEGEDLKSSPLSNIETAIGLKGFAWYTKDALKRAKEIWTDCIVSLASNKPINVVNKH